MKSTFLVLIMLFSFSMAADKPFAHEVRPGYLELRQTGPDAYDVFWKVPARGDLRLGLYVSLPDNCQNVSSPRNYQSAGAFIERWSVTCKGSLTNKKIHI